MDKEITDREQEILKTVIFEHIKSAQPVGSKQIANFFQVSSATIRNIFARLEKKGFLMQPYTSAGRLPTDYGYQFFVENLLMPVRISPSQLRKIKKIKDEVGFGIEKTISKSSQILGEISQLIAFASLPEIENIKIQYIDISPEFENQILLIVIGELGNVWYKWFNLGVPFPVIQIKMKSLNNKIKGKRIKEIKNLLTEEDSLENLILNEIYKLKFEYPELIINSEYASYTLGELNKAKKEFKQIINQICKKQDITVMVCNEDICYLKGYSIIGAPYQIYNQFLGVLGVIAPKRIDYPKVIAQVDLITKFINKLFSSSLEGN